MKSKRLVKAAVVGVVSLCGLVWGPDMARQARADTDSDDLNQSQSNRLSIFHDYGIDAEGSTSGGIPNPSGGGLAASYLGRFAAAQPIVLDKDWALSATPLIGYDSNPEARQLAKGSFYGGMGLAANYAADLTPDNPTPVFFTAGLNGAVYEGEVKEADVLQIYGAGGIRHSYFDDSILLSAQMKDQWTVEHGTGFLNAFDFLPAMEFFWARQISTEIAVDYGNLEYSFPVDTRINPSTSRYDLNFNLHLYTLPQGKNATVGDAPDQLTEILRQSLHSVVLGYAHVWNQADGFAYKYQSNRLSIGFDGIRPLKSPDLNMGFYYAHEFQNYAYNTPIATDSLNVPTVHDRRKDHLDIFTFRSDARLADLAHNRGTLGGYFQWDVVRDFSNIPIRDFNEFIVSAGITFQY